MRSQFATAKQTGNKAIALLRSQIVTTNSIESLQDRKWKSQIVTSNISNNDGADLWTSQILIIDDAVYLLGASVKDLGNGLCAVTKLTVKPEIILGMVK